MKRIFQIIIFCVCMITFSGCKSSDDNNGWKEKNFKFSEKADEDNEYWVDHYDLLQSDEGQAQGEGQLKYAVIPPKAWHEKTFRLYAMITPPIYKANKWIVEIYDAKTKQLQTKEITYELLGLKDELNTDSMSYLVDMDIVDENHYVFQWVTVSVNGEKYSQTSDERIYLDLNGEIRQIDLWESYKEQGVLIGEMIDYSFVPSASCLCDRFGNTYQVMRCGEETHIFVFDDHAKVKINYQVPKQWEIIDYLKTDQDELIYLCSDENEKTKRILWFDLSENKVNEVACIATEESIIQLCGMVGNEIYYENNQGMVYVWNVENGKRSLLIDYKENTILTTYGRLYVVGTDIPPQIRLYRNSNNANEVSDEWITILSKEKNENAVRIEILATEDGGYEMLNELAAFTTRRNPNYIFTCEKNSSEEQRKLLTNELISGKGPDVLYVPRDYFVTLAEKGILLDISEMLDQREFNDVLPGALELGMYADKLKGLPIFVTVSGLLISDTIWDQDHWSFDDMLRLMREHKIDQSLYYINSGTSFTPLASARIIIMRCLQEPWLIDWNNKKCNFTDERFIEFLTLLRDQITEDDEGEWLNQGRRLACLDMVNEEYVYDFGIMEEIENGHYVGFPTNGVCGNYLSTEGILVVNANSNHIEAVKDLMRNLLEEYIPNEGGRNVNSSLSIRKLYFKDIEIVDNGKSYVNGKEIKYLKSGEITFDTAEAFLESCVAAPLGDSMIENILMEELPAYFMGEKSVNQVVDNIQNRVQLYLDEK